jgi:hypothetical protein
MNVRRFFDRVQLNLHLFGFHRLALFFGRLGTSALPSEVDEHDRPTLPYGIRAVEVLGPRMQVLEFDPTFNHNPGIDFEKDLAFPTTKLDIN